MSDAIRSVMLDGDHSRVHVTVAGREYTLMLEASRVSGALWIDGLRTTSTEDREIGHLYDAIEAEIARILDEEREADGRVAAAAFAAHITGCLDDEEG